MSPTKVCGNRRPQSPLMTNPASGNASNNKTADQSSTDPFKTDQAIASCVPAIILHPSVAKSERLVCRGKSLSWLIATPTNRQVGKSASRQSWQFGRG
jgi:hypothetical protein